MALELKDHQVKGVQWLRDRPRALLADEPGLGKTAQLLGAAIEPVLVVAPAMVLESGTWNDEIEKWAPGIDATQVSYTSVCQRGKKGQVARDSNGFPRVPLKPEYSGKWGSVILDEAHYVKGRKTSWSVALQDLDTDQIHLATGTPIPNWAQEAFMLLRLLWPDEARAGHEYGSYWRWCQKWFEVEQNFFGAREVGGLNDRWRWEDFREQNWGDRMLQRFRDECLDLPPLTRQEWRVKMKPEQARVYRDLKKDLVAWLDSGNEISVWSEPALLVKLAKCATGLESLSPGERSSGKMDALRTILTDRPRPTLVVAHFQSSVEACAAAAHELGLRSATVHGGIPSAERSSAIRAFQAGEIDVLAASLNTISEGMTLHQGGADQIVFVERSWTPSRNEQALRRLHRMGVSSSVHAIDLVTKSSVDERVIRMLAEKTDEQAAALGVGELLG